MNYILISLSLKCERMCISELMKFQVSCNIKNMLEIHMGISSFLSLWPKYLVILVLVEILWKRRSLFWFSLYFFNSLMTLGSEPRTPHMPGSNSPTELFPQGQIYFWLTVAKRCWSILWRKAWWNCFLVVGHHGDLKARNTVCRWGLGMVFILQNPTSTTKVPPS